jgi:hypothetical protein
MPTDTNKRNELPRHNDPTTSHAGRGQIVTTLIAVNFRKNASTR